MKQILEIILSILLTILAFIVFFIVWSPMILLMFIFSMICFFLVPWLGYIFFILSGLFILLKFIVDLLNETGTL